MRFLRTASAASLVFALAACVMNSPEPGRLPDEPPMRSFPAPEMRESVYLPVDRTSLPPAGYGLYTVLLARASDAKTVRVLSELFTTTGRAEDAAIARENLNLITIPVRNTGEAARAMAGARNKAEVTANAVMQTHYDFDHAALLMASVCRDDRGAAVMKVCGSTSPDGPLLVTAQSPLDGGVNPGQRLLIVNLSTTQPEALREVLAAYRQQILRKDFADRVALDGWRLWALDHVLDAAHLLPGIAKAYADNR
jgi:hypothetical protein